MIKPAEINLVLVDFDDTLVATAPRFRIARQLLFEMLVQHGFPEADVRRVHHDEVDPMMRQRFGFGPQRMAAAFEETYRQLCTAAGQACEHDIVQRCGRLGASVAGAPPLIDGALPALRNLAATLPTLIYTQAGNPEYQLACIQQSGVLDVVSPQRVRICAHKCTDHFRSLVVDFGIADPATIWMIGNSVRSDVNPALECGANAVLVEMEEPWEFDVVEPVSDGFHRAGSFSAAVELLLGVAGLKCR